MGSSVGGLFCTRRCQYVSSNWLCQAILWMATMTTVFGYFAGLRGAFLIILGGIVGFEFKKQVVNAYLNGEGGYTYLANKFGINYFYFVYVLVFY